jgi:hypothetical protein
MSLDQFLNLSPSEHTSVGNFDFAIQEILGIDPSDSYNLVDTSGELRALLACPDRIARLIFLNYRAKPSMPVILLGDWKKLSLKAVGLKAEICVRGNELELLVDTNWNCQNLEVYVARDEEESLSILKMEAKCKPIAH